VSLEEQVSSKTRAQDLLASALHEGLSEAHDVLRATNSAEDAFDAVLLTGPAYSHLQDGGLSYPNDQLAREQIRTLLASSVVASTVKSSDFFLLELDRLVSTPVSEVRLRSLKAYAELSTDSRTLTLSRLTKCLGGLEGLPSAATATPLRRWAVGTVFYCSPEVPLAAWRDGLALGSGVATLSLLLTLTRHLEHGRGLSERDIASLLDRVEDRLAPRP
jgi:hypothetical protein